MTCYFKVSWYIKSDFCSASPLSLSKKGYMRVTNWLSTVVLSTLIMLAIALHETQGEFLVKGLTKKTQKPCSIPNLQKTTQTSSSSCWFWGSRSGGGLPSINQDVFNCKFGNGTCNDMSAITMNMNENRTRWKYLNGNEWYSSAISLRNIYSLCVLFVSVCFFSLIIVLL